MKPWGTTLYFIVVAAIFAGFIYLGITNGFSDALDISFVALLWVFVVLAMKTRLLKVPPGTPLPLSNLRINLKTPKLLRALLLASLAICWTAASVWFVHLHGWVVFLGLFVSFLAQGFNVTFRRR
jgi:hypothetical protein